ncbi:MAG: MoxR family ATPase [Pseudomonadota bacterium]
MTLLYTAESLPPEQRNVSKLPPSRRASQTDPMAYMPDPELVDAVNVALMLGQPLLLTGEAGTGKTQLAYHLAFQLGLEVHKFETKSNSQARDLFYTYNTLGRFQAAQTQEGSQRGSDYLTFNALGLAIMQTNPGEQTADYLPPDFVRGEPCRSVVLIDEIDKAPRDFPNDILSEVENLYFRIPELDNVKLEANPELSPILVLTSNSEKHLPDAFLRRCAFHHIAFPSRERLQAIADARLGQQLRLNDMFLDQALTLFEELRSPRSGLRKKPATAELLNWLQALRGLYPDSDNPLAETNSVKRTLGSLVKTSEDQVSALAVINS